MLRINFLIKTRGTIKFEYRNENISIYRPTYKSVNNRIGFTSAAKIKAVEDDPVG